MNPYIQVPVENASTFRKYNLASETALRDFTIASESGKEWRVHKLMLHMHSDVLYRMATSPDFRECQTGKAVLKDAGDDCIDNMIAYFYTLILHQPPCIRGIPEAGPAGQLMIEDCIAFYGGVWTLADMYNVPGLKEAMAKDFDRWLERQALTLDFVENLLEVVVEGVSLDVLVSHLMGFLARVWGPRGHGHSVKKVIALLEKYPEVAMEVLKAVVRRNGSSTAYDYSAQLDAEARRNAGLPPLPPPRPW